jgi:hypothetical protein
MMDAIFAAILKELMLKYPGIAWASIWVQIVDAVDKMGPGPREEFNRWWDREMDLPFPGMEPQENPGEPYDPSKG